MSPKENEETLVPDPKLVASPKTLKLTYDEMNPLNRRSDLSTLFYSFLNVFGGAAVVDFFEELGRGEIPEK